MSWRHRTYAAATGNRRVREVVESLPKSVALGDGTRRRGTVRLWRLMRSWEAVESGREEAAGAYAAYEGGDMIDVGAYEGFYSLLLAPKAGPGDRFVSFEPDARAFPDLLSVLADVGRLFPALGLLALSQPVGDGSPTELQWPEEGTEGHPRFAGGVAAGAPPSLTIDRLVETMGLDPNFVKIDVEGAEWFVLNGMTSTLAEHGPVVMLELHPSFLPEGVSPESVEELLVRHGYAREVMQRSGDFERQVWRPTNS